ncbi:MAG TPA: hypothetical protein DDY04_08310 [Bacteroidales bacterium]|nr:hypothetical protein [Bacteroidales bacterium]
MNVEKQIKLSFHGVDILNVQFIAENILDKNVNVDIIIKPKVFYPVNSPLEFKIIFDTQLKANGFFELKLNAIGHFSISNDVDEETQKKFINTNAPAIMFPYVRSFITTFTSNLGNVTGPLTIPPHFFSGQLEELTENSLPRP